MRENTRLTCEGVDSHFAIDIKVSLTRAECRHCIQVQINSPLVHRVASTRLYEVSLPLEMTVWRQYSHLHRQHRVLAIRTRRQQGSSCPSRQTIMPSRLRVRVVQAVRLCSAPPPLAIVCQATVVRPRPAMTASVGDGCARIVLSAGPMKSLLVPMAKPSYLVDRVRYLLVVNSLRPGTLWMINTEF